MRLNKQQKYWSDTSPKICNPSNYLKERGFTEYLLYTINLLNIPKNNSFIEFGCGPGRNLMAIRGEGYKNIYGVDINRKFVQVAKKYGLTVENTTFEKWVVNNKYIGHDVLLTVAFLMEISDESFRIFINHIKMINKYLIIAEIEDASEVRWHVTPRNYFNKLNGVAGFYQIAQIPLDSIESYSGYKLRVFEKK